MNVSDLIGKVVTTYRGGELSDDRKGDRGGQEGTARYIIDCLTAEQTAAIARQILGNPSLAGRVALKLPAHFVTGHVLPEDVLTTYPATYFRNATLDKPVLLVANTGDDEEQSLKEFIRIGAPELQEHPALWVRIAGDGLNLSDVHARWWEKAIAGLQELRVVSLERLAGYILKTRETVLSDGLPVLNALGAALPALRFPRDTVFSNRVKEVSRGHASAWKTQYNFVARNRGCYLLKQTPAQLFLGEEELKSSFEKAKETIPEGHHAIIQAFIRAPSGWNDAASRLSECEWEEVKPLFDGVKREKFNLAQETVHFFDEREPELLTVEERDYLRLLVGRSTTEATEEDNTFYEAHRNELKEDRKLKSAWDRFVFGKPREADDFLAGLAASMESLFNQGDAGAKRRLKVRCDRATKRDLRELNVDAGLYFAKRYAGLRTLFGDRVTWNVGQLFDFPALVETWRTQGRAPLNRSLAKAALQLKFVLELEVELPAGGSQSYTTQLLCKSNPNTITIEFSDDWSRLEEHPLASCRASRESLGAKARAQTVDLSNVRTFVPAFGRDRGSFVALYRRTHDIAFTRRDQSSENS